MWVFLIINVVTLLALEVALLYILRAVLATTQLSDAIKQVAFVLLSVVLFSPVIVPVGIGISMLVPNVTLLVFGFSWELLDWYSLTARWVVPLMFVTAAVSWWFGSARFLNDAHRSLEN
jgi:hypothetical protein